MAVVFEAMQGALVHPLDVQVVKTWAVRTEYAGKPWWIVVLALDWPPIATTPEAISKQRLLGVTVTLKD